MSKASRKDYYNDYWTYRKSEGRIHTQDGMWIPRRIRLTTDWIAADIAARGASSASILDVGCGEGTTGKMVKEKTKADLRLWGCDISTTALDMAKEHYAEVFQMDIVNDEFPQKMQQEKVDYVVNLDVLEHVLEPMAPIRKYHTVLKPDGKYIASFPNIAFYEYRWNLLKGHFPADFLFGASDHVQQFTLHSFSELLRKCDFEPQKVDAQFKFPKWIKPGRVFRPFMKKFPNMFGYQVVVQSSPFQQSSD